MEQTVAILGGGVAGLSAAHELAERGFKVRVYERNPVFGGKARSIPAPGTAVGDRRDLPGEHGFRFFPSFYKHVTDTMSRIPYPGNSRGVLDNLVHASRMLLATADDSPVEIPTGVPRNGDDFFTELESLMRFSFAVPPHETMFYMSRLALLLSTCEERREAEYEQIPWWEFNAAAQMSKQYQRFLGKGFTRSLVAIRAEEASTRTAGYIGLQLAMGLTNLGGGVDRLLNGPTSEVWIDPWVAYLRGLGVEFYGESSVEAIKLDGGRIGGVTIANQGQRQDISAAYYIAAMPVEVMARLATDDLKQAAPSLANLDKLKTSWMNGLQFYLREDVPLAHGHVILADAPWALTAVSQRQFWQDVDLCGYGDGTVRGILSVDVSDWDTPGILYGKAARNCSAAEIKSEVWAQLLSHLPGHYGHDLAAAGTVASFLDPAIEFPAPGVTTNREPLLINTVGSLRHRPQAHTEIANLFVAADYVRTYSDVACMETANEAARRAANAILSAAGSTEPYAQIWPLEEPAVFAPAKELDRQLFRQGLPHPNQAGANMLGMASDLVLGTPLQLLGLIK